MSEQFPLQQQLQEILQSHSLEALDAFKEPVSWQGMRPTDRELLGKLFVMKGEGLLKCGDSSAVDYFNRAAQVASDSGQIFFLLGKAFAAQEHSVNSLGSALLYFKQAASLAPASFDLWYGWAQALRQKGLLLGVVDYFYEAEEKFAHAFELLEGDRQELSAELLWRWGKNYYAAGMIAGEAIDFHNALAKCGSAAECGLDSAEFWTDYGHIYLELARLLNRRDLYNSAVGCYHKAIATAHDLYDAWRSLGFCYYHLFEGNFNADYYVCAAVSFENGSKLHSDDSSLWLQWGRLQFEHGRQSCDRDLLEESLGKFHRADILSPQQPSILCSWGEALLYCGSVVDSLDWLKEAQGKFMRALELQPDNHEAWHLLGACLNELGRYFGDARYFKLAIEKFQHGLSINKLSPSLWYGLAASHFSLGEISGDAKLVEKASRFYEKAMENKKTTDPQHWNGWGIVLLKLAEITNEKRNVEAAVAKFEQALMLYSSRNGDDDLDPDLLYNYGCALDFLGDFYEEACYYEKAVQALTKVLQIDSEYTAARYNLALALSHLGEQTADVECFHQAIDQFQMLLTVDREDGMVWSEYGLTLLNLAQLVHDAALPDKSLQYYEDAADKLLCAVSLGCLQASYYLACLFSLLRRFDDAMFYIERADSQDALPPIDEVMRDDWLESLRQTTAFKIWLERRDVP
jgi:tetratricopeptide (TPR) repeat protein